MFCPQCGKGIPDGAKFCTHCGTPTKNETELTAHSEQEIHQNDLPSKTHESARENREPVASSLSSKPATTEAPPTEPFRDRIINILQKAAINPIALKSFAPQGAIYLALIFIPPLILSALLAIAMNGSVAGLLPQGFESFSSFLNLMDPRVIFALVSLGFGGSLSISASADVSSAASTAGSALGGLTGISGLDTLFSGAAAEVATPSGSAEVAIPFLLAGCLASAATIVYALKFSKNTALYEQTSIAGYSIIVGLVAALAYALIEFILPFTLSLSSLASLSISGLTFKTFGSMWLWSSASVLIAETLRQGKIQKGSALSYVKEQLARHAILRDVWHVAVSALIIATLAGMVLIVFILIGLATSVGSSSFSSVSGYCIPVIFMIIATPLTMFAAAFLIGAPISFSAGASGNDTTQLLSSLSSNSSPTSTSLSQDYSILSLASVSIVIVIVAIIFYILFVALLAIMRHRALNQTSLQPKETARFIAVAVVLWAFASAFTATFITGSGSASIFGASGSVHVSLSGWTVVAGALFVLFADLVAIYIIPRFPFLSKLENFRIVGILAGDFSSNAPATWVPSKRQLRDNTPSVSVLPNAPTTRAEAISPSQPSDHKAECQQTASLDPLKAVTEYQPMIPATPSSSGAPRKTPNKKLRRTILIGGGSIVGTILVAIIAIQILGLTVFSPKNQVEAYYNALANGDIAAASELRDPNIDSVSRSMLATGTLDNTENRIQNVSVGDLHDNQITVSYRLDGIEQQEVIPMEEEGTEFLFFKKYKMATSALIFLPLDSNMYGKTLLVNGVEVTPERAEDAKGVSLPVYPGVYTITLPESTFFTSNTLRFVASTEVKSDTQKTNDGLYRFSIGFTNDLDSRVQSLVKQHLEACMATNDPAPSKAPFGLTYSSEKESFQGWTSIKAMPSISLATEAGQGSTGKMAVLSDGALYYGYASDGSVAYKAQGRSYEPTCRINTFDIYVNTSDDQVVLENSKGETLYGLDALSSENPSNSTSTDGKSSSVQVKSSLTDYSWAEIISIAKEIETASSQANALTIAKNYHLADATGAYPGDTKSLELSDGTSLEVQLVGIYHDNNAEGFGKTGLTFLTKNCYSAHAMNPTETNSGGWRDSDMRSWLNSTVFELFPSEVKTSILSAKKLTNNEGSSKQVSSVSETSDKLWLPSWVELFGTISWNKGTDQTYIDTILNAEGTQYNYFSKNGLADAQDSDTKGVLVKTLSSGSGPSIESWWVRSPAPNRSDGFGDVNNGGLDNGGLATASQGVVFGFCL